MNAMFEEELGMPEGGKLILESPYFRRELEISDMARTVGVWTRGAGCGNFMPHHHGGGWGLPYEAAVKIGGEWYDLSPQRQGNVLWPRPRLVFTVAEVMETADDEWRSVDLRCRPEPSGNDFMLEVVICYRVYTHLPCLEKYVKVRNAGNSDVVVENLCPEIMYGVRADRNLRFFHDYRLETRSGDERYPGYVCFRFPEDVSVTLPPGGEMESFKVYEVAVGDDPREAAAGVGRVLRHLAPGCLDNKIKFQLWNFVPEAVTAVREQLREVVDGCVAAGIEQLSFFVNQIWTNIGDYELRPDLFPGGEAELRELLDYIHRRGLEAGVYCSYSIAWQGSKAREEHRDWECLGIDGQSFDPGAYGNMCFLSGWGGYIRDRLSALLDMGFDYLDFDGPTDIPCHAAGHNHSSLGEYQYRSWRWERELFAWLFRRGTAFTIPRDLNYVLMGAGKIPGGYTEEDFCHCSGLELLTNYRCGIARNRERRPGWLSWGFLALDSYHGNGIGYGEDNLLPLEHGLASLLGYGSGSFITGQRCFKGGRSLAVMRKWTDWFKARRRVLSGESLVLGYPGGAGIDGIFHFNGGEGLTVFFNPFPVAKDGLFVIPLRLMRGNDAAAEINMEGEGELSKPDSRGDAVLRVTLAPWEIRTLDFRCVPAPTE